MISFDHVTKRFRKGGDSVCALDTVSFEIPKGTLATVRGPSGSGKTTLINIAAALMRPTSGSVTVAGRELAGLSAAEQVSFRANQVAVVFQMFHLVPYLTAFENVLLPTLAKPGNAERARQLIEEVGIEHRTNHYPDELSAGERQRCALARALLNEPEVILADEPTGNLDPESADRVIHTLDACRSSGATVLLVTHQPIDSVHPDLEFSLREGKLE
jgi:ABC-type lipoprotein export system ATPase subunit